MVRNKAVLEEGERYVRRREIKYEGDMYGRKEKGTIGRRGVCMVGRRYICMIGRRAV